MKLKIEIHKFDKGIAYQLLDIDDSLLDKRYFNGKSIYLSTSERIVGNQILRGGTSNTVGSTTNDVLLLNFYGDKNHIRTMKFKSNLERDYFYQELILELEKSINQNLWKSV